MRLIDADVLPEISLFGTTEYINVIKAPTVKAIQLEKLKEILDGYDGSIPSMITCFSEIQKLIESEAQAN